MSAMREWLFSHHPVFLGTREAILGALANRDLSLDDLVVASRRPARTVLLLLDQLYDEGLVTTMPDQGQVGRTDKERTPPSIDPHILSSAQSDDWIADYLLSIERSDEPALLWGQRRLVPESAVARGAQILNYMPPSGGSVAFLGDDDLVSPFVAKAAPTSNVYVYDIDRRILERVRETASVLGANLRVEQTDLSRKDLDLRKGCDVVVCDPFPSADGSFEVMFWRVAKRILRPGGILVTTVGPSHKPETFARGALQRLSELGFAVENLQAEHERYELFDFELVPYERTVLAERGLSLNLSHTKCLVSARSIPTELPDSTGFDFNAWARGAAGHYLTLQAGRDRQVRLASQRGLTPSADEDPSLINCHGLRIDYLVPAEMRPHLDSFLTDPEGAAKSVALALGRIAGTQLTAEESAELARLAHDSSLGLENGTSWLGLSVRALDSWQRERL